MKKFLLSCFVLLFSYSYAVVEGGNQTSWTTGSYEDNANLSKQLYIDGASMLKVTIKGSTEEGYDFVYIYDKDGHLVRKVSGSIDEEFIVDGSLITAKLVSDDAKEDKGVTVTIEKADGASSNYTSWIVNNYDNNENMEKRLHIDAATKLKVEVSGETEAGYDYLTIKDLNGNIIKELSGKFDEEFLVNSSDIIAQFVSDDATTDKGFSVKISNSDGTLPDVTTWTTGAYDNDDILTKDLRISKADSLKVKIQGSTEKDYDFVYIYDQNGELVKKVSGNIDEEFIVDGYFITAKLISDDSVTDSGITVTIEKAEVNPNPSNTPTVGSIANAKVKIYQIDSNGTKKLLWSETTSSGDTLKEIGKFNAHINDLKDDEIYLYVAKGGEDWDIDKDGIKDSKATKNYGIFRAIAKGEDIKEAGGRFNISVISEILFELSYKGLSLNYIKEKFNDTLNKNVAKVIDGNLVDLLTFNPLDDLETLNKVYKNEYYEYVKLIHTGKMPLLNIYGRLKTNGLSKDVVRLKSKKVVLVADWNNALLSVDVSDYSNPKIISSVDTMCSSVVVTEDETKAFVADKYDGLVYIDITNPSNITRESIFKKAAGAKRVILSRDETKAFIAAGKNGFIVVDIRDPYNMKILGNYTNLINAIDLSISKDESKAFIADGKGGLKILDISDLSNITLISKKDFKSEFFKPEVKSIAASKDESYLFLGIVGSTKLVIVDISNIKSPKTIYLNKQERHYAKIFGKIYTSSDGKKVYFTYYNSLTIYDISDITNPVVIKSYKTHYQSDFIYALSIYNNKLYLGTFKGLTIFNLYNKSLTMGKISSLSLAGSHYHNLNLINNDTLSFIDINAYPNDKKFLVDIKDIENPKIISTIDVEDIGIYGVISKDKKRAYTIEFDEEDGHKFVIYDISNLKSKIKLGSYPLEFRSGVLALSKDEKKAFVYEYVKGLIIFDVSDPKNIQEISSLANLYSVDKNDRVSNILFLNNEKIAYLHMEGAYYVDTSDRGYWKYYDYIDIVDLSNLSSPKLLKTIKLDDYHKYMAISKDETKLYAITNNKFIIYDTTNPKDIKKIYSGENFNAEDAPLKVSTKGNFIYLRTLKGVTFINVENPQHPFEIGSYDPGPYVEDTMLSKDDTKAFILHYNGLDIVDIGILQY